MNKRLHVFSEHHWVLENIFIGYYNQKLGVFHNSCYLIKHFLLLKLGVVHYTKSFITRVNTLNISGCKRKFDDKITNFIKNFPEDSINKVRHSVSTWKNEDL